MIGAAPPGGPARRSDGSPCPSSSPRPPAALGLASGGPGHASGLSAVALAVGLPPAPFAPLRCASARSGPLALARRRPRARSRRRGLGLAVPPPGPAAAGLCSPSAFLRPAAGCAASLAPLVALAPPWAPWRSPWALSRAPGGLRAAPAGPPWLAAGARAWLAGRSSPRGGSRPAARASGGCVPRPRALGLPSLPMFPQA